MVKITMSSYDEKGNITKKEVLNREFNKNENTIISKSLDINKKQTSIISKDLDINKDTIIVNKEKGDSDYYKIDFSFFNKKIKENKLTNMDITETIDVVIEDEINKTVKEKKPDYIKIGLPKKILSERKLNMYKVNPSSKIKNDDVLMVLNNFSQGYKEPFKLIEGLTYQDGKVNIPQQNLLSYEMLIKRSKMDFYVALDDSDSKKETIVNGFKYAWNESFFDEIEKDVVDDFIIKNETIVGYEIKLMKINSYMLKVDGKNVNGSGMVKDLLELSKILTEKDKILLQICMQPAESYWAKYSKEILEEEKIKGVKNYEKFKYGACDVSIRLIVSAEDKERSEIIGNSFLMVLRKLDGDNALIGSAIKDRNKLDWLKNDVKKRKVSGSFRFKHRNILSVKELEHFIKMPTKNIQQEYNLDVDEKKHMKVPESLLKKKGIKLGYVTVKGHTREIVLDDNNKDDFMKSYCFVGSPRTGKDTSMVNFIVESAKNGHGAIIPDAINEMGNDRGMADSIRDALPKDKIIDISLDDYNFPVYFGLEDIMDLIGHNGINLMADNLIQILGLAENYASKKLTRLIAKACKCNLYDMYCFVRSDKYAQEVLERVMLEDELLGLELKHEYIDTSVPSNVKGAILSRLDEVMGNDLLKYMFAQQKNNKLDIKKWISEGKVIIIRMTKTEIGELGTQVLMFLLTLRVFWIKKMLNKDPLIKDKCVFMVFNEFFQYMSKSLEEVLMQMIVECPKYRLGMLFAFHSPTKNQISSDFWETLKSSSLNYFLFKNTNEKVYTDMSHTLKPITSEMAMKTEKYESIFIPYVGGKQLEPFFMKMLAPPSQRQNMFDNSNLTEDHKSEYGTPLKDVIDRVREREIWMYNNEEDTDEEEKEEGIENKEDTKTVGNVEVIENVQENKPVRPAKKRTANRSKAKK